ncbi:MAG: alpha-glucosidase/alpha-galactosidase [Anaerolineales bacterium]|nr:alpha-glucosidase/alpha-galactosidase [Chloroflexota bacterium]MBL6983686.1 alpha-glucosidase/alpha-galactosidase [Anaerolineales bacterium]
MIKIAFIGAGSTVFAKNLLGDILSYPELAESTICLHDIDSQRLRDTEKVAQRIIEKLGVNPTIETTTDQRAALDGSLYAINMIQVGGYEPATVIDFEIPKKYGLRQTIGDTLGIGGIMRALRTIPVMLEMVRDMEELCPNVLHLNYVNPMAMITWALNRASEINTVGLCHSVPHTASQLAEDIGIPVDEINYLVAGINHLAFYLRFERGGEDLYPLLYKVIEEDRVPDWNRVRYDLFKRLSYFVTESSEHLSEYVPWYIKRHRPDLIERFNIPLDEYLFRCQAQIHAWDFAQEYLDDPDKSPLSSLEKRLAEIPGMPTIRQESIQSYQKIDGVSHSVEYAGQIIHSIETGTPRTIYGNVPNLGLIKNLPQDCCVEVPCLVNQNGVQPTQIGSLPPQLAALMQTNINVQALTVEAALTGKREHIYHAAMLDPHTAAELDLDQIWALLDELIEAHGEWLPDYH